MSLTALEGNRVGTAVESPSASTHILFLHSLLPALLPSMPVRKIKILLLQSSEGRKVRIGGDCSERVDAKYFLGGCDQYNDAAKRQQVVVRARCAAARLLGK